MVNDSRRGIAETAQWIAAVRAQESRRQDRLFQDPWAAALAGEEGAAWIGARAKGPTLELIALRARFFDDFLQRCVAEHEIRQIVLPGAGLDTRAYRLPWPDGVRVYELDQQQVLRSKDEVLRGAAAHPRCDRRAVEIDLLSDWVPALDAAGFDRTRPACWLLEGLLFYLPEERVAELLDRVTAVAAPESRIGFDVPTPATLTHPMTRPWVEMQAQHGAPWLCAMDDPAAVLEPRGWDVNLSQPGEEGASFGRWPYPVLPRGVAGVPRTWLVTASRRAR